MKIINNTNWDTVQLKKIFTRCMHEIWKTDKKILHTVYVDNHRGAMWIGGNAPYYGSHLTMKLPTIETGFRLRHEFKFFSQGIADTFIHEVGHTLGIKHNKNNDTFERHYQEWIVKTFNDETYPVSIKVEKGKEVKDKRLIRYERAKTNLDKAITRLNRAKTLYTKWNLKVRHYDTVFGQPHRNEKLK